MLCSYALLDSPIIRYAERGVRRISCVAARRPLDGFVAPGDTYGRNRIRQGDSNDTPATMAYCGASRCHPIGEPARYSLISAIANASGSMPAHAATRVISGRKKSGIGGAALGSSDVAPRSYVAP